MDPGTALAVAKASVSVLKSGLKLAKWDGWGAWPARPDALEWLANLLELNTDAVSAIGELVAPFRPGTTPNSAAQLWAIHVACFGEALADHWGGHAGMSGRRNRWFDGAWQRERADRIEQCMRFSLDLLARADTSSPLSPKTWLDAPCTTPTYKALWQAFTRVDGQPLDLLDLSQAAVGAFERAFTQAFREAMTRNRNVELRRELADDSIYFADLWTRSVTAIADSRHQPIFADVTGATTLPALSLERGYIEPTAVAQSGSDTTTGPACTVITNLLARHNIVLVSAGFGHGKSLTARTLAWRLAVDFQASTAIPTAERIFPVYVRCQEDLAGVGSIREAIDNAQRRLINSLGAAVHAVMPPHPGRTLYILDGLDEVVLSEQQILAYLRECNRNFDRNSSYVLFFRPDLLTRLNLETTELPDFPRVRLEGFSDEQIDDWLWAWQKEHAPTRDDLSRLGLRESASVPVFLFMVALAWPELERSPTRSRNAIYDSFLRALADGKVRDDRHPPIRQAAKAACDALVRCGVLAPYDTTTAGVRAVEALRWMMDSIAWEQHRHAFRGESLSRASVDRLIDTELALENQSTRDIVRNGLLLAMQADPSGGGLRLLFGHRTFAEYSIARFWARQLRRLCECKDPEKRRDITHTLTGGPLDGQDSAIFPMLREMLDAWTEEDAARLFEWAKATVDDDSLDCPRGAPTFVGDTRLLLRQAALAIGCHIGRKLRRYFYRETARTRHSSRVGSWVTRRAGARPRSRVGGACW